MMRRYRIVLAVGVASILLACGGGGGSSSGEAANENLTIALTLNDTGITTDQCYSAGSNQLVSCLSLGALQLNSSQDGMTGRDVLVGGSKGFIFSSVNKSDSTLYEKTECVKDNVTGLIWEGKPSSGLRSGNNVYTNYGDGRDGDASAYVKTVNQQVLCGFSDWRLPTLDELHSLVDYGITPSVAAKNFQIDEKWLPTNIITLDSINADNPGSFYWTGTKNTIYQNWWGYVDFNSFTHQKVSAIGSANLIHVRLVRGAKASVALRYVSSQDGSEINDSITGLTWRRCSEGQTWTGSSCSGSPAIYTHEAALVRANSQGGWRLPNIKELQTLADLTRRNPAIDTQAFPNMPSCDAPTYCGYWSSTPDLLTSGKGVFTTFFGTGSSANFTPVIGGYRNELNFHMRLVKIK